ncbi:MAG: F0F1 ATP synthase subunit gamma [Candidatus Omnitrophica bacterium]|nr:F0F1 ATP synthase subunit gamma [Candidatus Omnitrophota bacterium]
MPLISAIKKDLEFNHSLYNIIEVLREISISQYRSLEKRIRPFDKIFEALVDLFSLFDMSKCDHPLINPGNRACAIVAITTDSGLLGGLNMQVMNLALKELQETRGKLIIIGQRGKNYAQEKNLPFVSFKGVTEETRNNLAIELRDYIVKEELALNIGVLKVFYPHSESLFSQHVKSINLLPFTKDDLGSRRPLNYNELIYESKLEDLVGFISFLLLGRKFYEIFGFSKLAELSARYMHLENSKTKIEQLDKQLRLQYFRQRHELIDRNMRELFTARLAFR